LPLDRVLQTLPAFTTTSTLTPPAEEGRSDDELLPGLRWPSPWCCSIPSAPHPPSNAAAAVRPRIRTRAAALIHLAAPATAGAGGEARGSVGGTESEAMGHERGARGIAGAGGRAGGRAGARALAGWLASGRIGSCSCAPPAWPEIRFFFSFLGGTKCTGAGNAGGLLLLLLSRAAVDPSPPRPPHVGVVARDGRRRGPAEPRDRERRAAANPEGPNPTPLSDDGGMATDRKCLWPCDSPTKAK
jgi:hypothetical protein